MNPSVIQRKTLSGSRFSFTHSTHLSFDRWWENFVLLLDFFFLLLYTFFSPQVVSETGHLSFYYILTCRSPKNILVEAFHILGVGLEKSVRSPMSQSCRKPHEGGCKQGITSMCGVKGEGRVAVVNLWPSWLKTAVLLSSFWAWTKDNLIRLINKIIERDKNWVFAKELVKSQNIPVSNSLYQLQLSYLRFHREQTL